MKKLYLVRHGLTDLNVAGVYAGRSEATLTDKGREQARLAGKHAHSLNIDTIVCSTQSRAIETAELIAAEINFPLDKIKHNDLLVERDFGPLEGTPYVHDRNFDDIPDLESDEAILDRAKQAVKWIESLTADNVLIVTHGSTGRAIRSIVLEEQHFHTSAHLPNAEIVELM